MGIPSNGESGIRKGLSGGLQIASSQNPHAVELQGTGQDCPEYAAEEREAGHSVAGAEDL